MPTTPTVPPVADDAVSAVTTAAAQPASYEAAMAELEALVASMESGALPLEESLAAYRRGAELVRYCQQTLERVEQQVRVLDGDILKPMGDAGAQADTE
ncbi:exodeoxyribonuclease VII small subunit [Cupriavidus sp. AU9028]|uniref:exodeoxyribonuclease VII small subunit n=1 Tax=Cupriavidus sp. AU9028 TaxID=2871157 RepID=UPI001C978123|nr:exodeoxyribonuclease VII small subunit [Cupriavidus sp. AU9028]MBY4896466.1 exodeoxyribonuclease VII small subunit [Cupriavidus sp. AU9028]